MKVNYNFVILILVLGFAIFMSSIKENLEHFVCKTEEIKKAYQSGLFKPRRPEDITCTTQKDGTKTDGTKTDDTGVEKTVCTNTDYKDDATIKKTFKVKGVPDDCILELVKTWNW